MVAGTNSNWPIWKICSESGLCEIIEPCKSHSCFLELFYYYKNAKKILYISATLVDLLIRQKIGRFLCHH